MSKAVPFLAVCQAAGGPNGNITLFRGRTAYKEVVAHSAQCRCLCVRPAAAEGGGEGGGGGGGSVLLSGGADGLVMTWEIVEPPAWPGAQGHGAAHQEAVLAGGWWTDEQAAAEAGRFAEPQFWAQPGGGAPLPRVKLFFLGAGDLVKAGEAETPGGRGVHFTALDTDPNDRVKFIAGSKQNDIWEIDADSRVLVEGQSHDVYGLAAHPSRPYVYASGCEDGGVYLWGAERPAEGAAAVEDTILSDVALDLARAPLFAALPLCSFCFVFSACPRGYTAKSFLF
eukprot:SAG22_NODE_943_length_6400_cov_3.214093_3_plen_283_part_00